MPPYNVSPLASTPLHPAVAAELQRRQYIGQGSSFAAGDHTAVRRAFHGKDHAKREPVPYVRDISIPSSSPDVSNLVRLYVPTPDAAEPLPVVVFYHGGGFTVGSLDTVDAMAAGIALRVPCAVVSVDYRLAPEHPYPVPFLDCLSAAVWVFDHADEFNLDRTRIALAGDSAGGNLAAAVALRLGEPEFSARGIKIAHVTMAYPATDLRFDADAYDSYKRNGEGYGLDFAATQWCLNNYISGLRATPLSPEERLRITSDMFVSPVVATAEQIRDRLGGVKGLHVLTAGYDPICDEGVRFARNIEAALPSGVVTHSHYPAFMHGFLEAFLEPAIPEAKAAMEDVCARIAKSFGLREVK
ncbi:hypothetical protein M427DRAFT_141268 [Gonapodya prolifera JEL478]|uniref:Alpha/beta hydrolase fold-3 domain-containing protein n=1 Tax=Gonapodya prolifera (strain JEL478) TaxID=1344416 RepID=A0A138ZYK7_GONPJ|nr:hypothetical protein M427DRAFT_141268 [Gonapodya prolifera JEL478]|eukprot:KXS09203.1 hypothetical protein M427DRAFT_141268 [Gonapodya prolifera JEL478]